VINLDAANKALREIVRSLLAMPENSVRPANQNAPTGTVSDQFATVLLTTIEKRGQDDWYSADLNVPDQSIQETIVGQRRLTASIQFFRGDAMTKAARLQGLLQSSIAASMLQTAGLGLVAVGSPVNLTGVIDTYWEQRAQLEVQFHCISAEELTVPTYGTFPHVVKTE
jgi:hypothetical protein